LKRISILLIALLAFVVAACSSEQTSPSAEESAAASVAPSAPPSESATPSDVATGSPEASGSAGAIPPIAGMDPGCTQNPEFGDILPDAVGGEPLTLICMGGEAFASAGSADPAFNEFLDSVDADIEDVSAAVGGSADGSVGVFAIRAAGVEEDALEQNFLAANESQGAIANVEQQTIAGKDVWTAESNDPEMPGTAVIYVKDDTVYFLTGTEEQAAEILAALP